jgi:alginate O-acetyltransferase complex protein AlgI
MISLEFFGILMLSLLLYWLLPAQWLRNLLLSAFSLLFIWLLDHQSLTVVLALSMFSYGFGHLIHRYPRQGWIHAVGVIGILSSLIIFKYLGFLSGVFATLYVFLESLPFFSIHHLLLPLGISYITFKQISYLTDIKWKLVAPGGFVDFLLYSSLFTIFLAGPIERFERLYPQISRGRIPFAMANLDYGSRRIAIGLFKKLVIADWIGFFIAGVWNNPAENPPALALAAVFAYAFQIYYDFAGYSDIAIGASRLFGLRIMENFDRPYLAQNISQFWRRWHISLSDWIRDYLFFPLSRWGKGRIWTLGFVPVIAMGLCGWWHGAELRYLVWGIWHGLGLVVYQSFQLFRRRQHRRVKNTLDALMAQISWPLTFLFVVLAWLSFRPFGFPLAKQIFLAPAAWIYVLFIFVMMMVIAHIMPVLQRLGKPRIRWQPVFTLYVLLIVGVLHCAMNTEFIYAAF